MNNKKNVLLIVLGLGIVAMTIAFAALSTNLRISGTASVPNTNWNIHFASWALDTASTVTVGSNTQQNTAVYPTVAQLQQSLAPNVTLVEGLNITLYQPNDYAKYTFDIVNDGTIDASLDNFTHTMTCESGKNCDFLEYTVECKDAQLNTVTNGYVLPHGQSVSCYLQLKFKDVDNTAKNDNQANNLQASVVNGVYTQEATSATLAANWSWIQKQVSQAQGGNSGGNEPQTPVSYVTTFNGTYGYDFAGAATSGNENNPGSSEWVNTLDPEVTAYLRSDGTKMETCGVFENGTVCMTSPYYNSDYSSEGSYERDFEFYNINPTYSDLHYDYLEYSCDEGEYDEDLNKCAICPDYSEYYDSAQKKCIYYDYNYESYAEINPNSYNDPIDNTYYYCEDGDDHYDENLNKCKVCPNNYEYDSENGKCVDYNQIVLTGYIKAKVDEMESKGATCSVQNGQVDCSMSYDNRCSIQSSGQVDCYSLHYYWTVFSDGSAGLGHPTP